MQAWIDGVVDSGAAASAGLENFVAEGSGVAGKTLEDLRLVVEGHDEGFVFVVAQDAEEEIGGGFLFEFEAVADAVGSVEEHADAEWEIGLLGEVADFLRGFVVENLEVGFFQVGTSLLRRSRTVKRMSTRLTRMGMVTGGLVRWGLSSGSLILAGAGVVVRALVPEIPRVRVEEAAERSRLAE